MNSAAGSPRDGVGHSSGELPDQHGRHVARPGASWTPPVRAPRQGGAAHAKPPPPARPPLPPPRPPAPPLPPPRQREDVLGPPPRQPARPPIRPPARPPVRRPARPRESAGYPLPTGLGKFDLGSIPASVTPPSSWRRAAWFAVGASILVAVGLIVATISLVSRPSKGDTIRAFPGLPTQQMLPTGLATSTGSSSSKSRASGSASGSASNGPGARPGGPGNAADLFSGRPTGVSGTSGSTSPYAAQPTTRPSRSTENAYPVAVTDPQKMGDRTEAYYRTVTQDPATAYSMTTGQMRSEGEEALRKRYENVSRVEVQKMTVDPTTSRCTATVKLVNKDGTASTEQRELSFSSGDDPKINSESAG